MKNVNGIIRNHSGNILPTLALVVAAVCIIGFCGIQLVLTVDQVAATSPQRIALEQLANN